VPVLDASPPQADRNSGALPPPSPPPTPGGGDGFYPEGPEKPKRRGTDRRTLAVDALMNWVITVGGLLIVAAVLGIFVFIFATVLPLFKGAKAKALPAYRPALPVRLFAWDEQKEKTFLVFSDGSAALLDNASLRIEKPVALPGLKKASVSCSDLSNQGFKITLGLGDGRAWLGQAAFSSRYDGDKRVVDAAVEGGELLRLDPRGLPLAAVRRGGEAPRLVAGLSQDGKILALLDKRALAFELPLGAGDALCLLVPEAADRLLVGTSKGRLLSYFVAGAKPGLEQDLAVFGGGEAVTALAYPLGQQSVVCGGSKGGLRSFMLADKDERREFVPVHRLESMAAAVTSIAASARDKGLLAMDAEGGLGLYFLTAERKLLRLKLPGGAGGRALLSPKGNGIMAWDGEGSLHSFDLDNPHPEASFKTILGKVWYEGYEKPEYVWQSTGGSDDFEPKFSLTPLIYGTLKGTFYALLFAVPLAIFGALYTSQFLSRRMRGIVKPMIEIMAAVPSVVMGFFAALLLAPFVENYLFTLILGMLAVPAVVLLSLWAWRSAPGRLTRRLGEENEIWPLAAGLLLGLALLALAGPRLEQALFPDFKAWLRLHFNIAYDQRNSLVVGFAMGFAVIPIIYTICEDALSSVPRHLVSASLSCGATPWQTALHVVLPVALSGIFSAVMVGFGRAVGETMIVLMATGNTPVMDFSAFDGFRALSANIAVEIPEAPVDGTLYRVLFLAAFFLFAMTFAVNTVAETIRLHLRKKYSQL
jgi:phosphate transport system permease protein